MRLAPSPRCVITGAAGGLGRAMALVLAKRGARLVLSDKKLPGVLETAELAQKAGAASAKALACDVTRIGDVEALRDACDGGADLVVNNAGVSTAGIIGELSLDDWRWTLDVDLLGVIHGCHVFVPMLKEQRRGHVLNIASAAAFISSPRMAAYNVAKAGVVSLSETLAGELVGTGVGVTVFCPTFVRTNIVSSGHFADDGTRKMAERLVSFGRGVEPIAKDAIDAAERGELYAVPMVEGRVLWRLKRLAPRTFSRVMGLTTKFFA